GLLLSRRGLGSTPHDGSSHSRAYNGLRERPHGCVRFGSGSRIGWQAPRPLRALLGYYKIPTGPPEWGRAAALLRRADTARTPVYRLFLPLGPHSLWWRSVTRPTCCAAGVLAGH